MSLKVGSVVVDAKLESKDFDSSLERLENKLGDLSDVGVDINANDNASEELEGVIELGEEVDELDPNGINATLRIPNTDETFKTVNWLDIEEEEPMVAYIELWALSVRYTNYLKYGEGVQPAIAWGEQPRCIGLARVFVTPNPSPANAAYSLEVLTDWFRQLERYRVFLKNRHRGD